ncbi:MAG: RsmB/NOP family class I SAM-dependent RNA methyltransferase [Coriobacteriia bacterium]|nr:RsmB/NOP family class I SAM-dependent RNA methyltransferase [Coriobacteriia bacterium]
MTYDETASLLPDFFAPLLAESYADDDVRRIVAGCGVERATTLRANTLLSDREEVEAMLDRAGIPWEPVPWYADAFVLPGTPAKALWGLEEYRAGKVYLQSLSSMLPPLVVEPAAGLDILDMCAAPGGKTCQMAALGGPQAHITACEMNVPRAEKLEYNLGKQGARNVMVMRTDARRLDDFFSFDRVLLDAPCSGSGTLRASDPKMPKRFTPALIQKSTKSQRALLTKALQVTKPGGFCVYSTCSVLPQENHLMVEEVLKSLRKKGSWRVEPIELADDLRAAGAPLLPCELEEAICMCPTDRFEGFFVCKISRQA